MRDYFHVHGRKMRLLVSCSRKNDHPEGIVIKVCSLSYYVLTARAGMVIVSCIV